MDDTSGFPLSDQIWMYEEIGRLQAEIERLRGECEANRALKSMAQRAQYDAEQRAEAAERRVGELESYAEERGAELQRQKDINKALKRAMTTEGRDPDAALLAAEVEEWKAKHAALKRMYKQARRDSRTPAEPRPCRLCGHPMDEHFILANRWACKATFGCGCDSPVEVPAEPQEDER